VREGKLRARLSRKEVILYEFRGFKVLKKLYFPSVYGLKDPNWNGAFFQNQ